MIKSLIESHQITPRDNTLPSLVTLIFIALFIKGIVFVLLIPLWQGPDEPIHIEYIMRLSQHSSYRADLESDKRVRDRIIGSMKKYGFDFQGTQMSTVDISPLADSSYPPFFYFLNAFFIKFFNIESFINQIYFMRLLSMLLGILNIFFIYLISKAMVFQKNDLFPIAVISFAGFLPQFSYISATVNPHNLVNLFITIIIFNCLLIISNGYRLHYLASLFLGVLAGWFTQKIIYMVFPFLIVVFMAQNGRWRQYSHRFKKIFVLLFLSFTVVLFLLKLNGSLTFIIEQVTGVLESISRLIMIGFTRPFFWFKEIAILFVSFWLSFGHMVYKISLGWSFFLFFLTTLSFIGILNIRKNFLEKKEFVNLINKKSVLILLLLLIINFVAIFLDESKGLNYDNSSPMLNYAQGRYLFPSLSSIACIFVLGIWGLVSESNRSKSMKMVILFMIFFNIVSVFKYLIPIYYLKPSHV